jgi:lipoprotein-anchoring transpeptidase ErfK/SrfK
VRSGGALPAVMLVALASATVGCGPWASPKPPPPPPPRAEVAKSGPYLILRLHERKLYLMKEEGAPPLGAFPVAIGQPRWPTPTGKFQINEMVPTPDFLVFDFNDPNSRTRGRVPPGPNSPLGLRWIGFAYAHGWSIGFHGTAKTQFLGQAVSHGCVRMRNEDVVRVFDQVKLGTTVIVEP